ncbi:hypothetical protein ACLK19_17025 [Escherichia coli]
MPRGRCTSHHHAAASTEDNALLLIDLGKGNNALGATALAQVIVSLATNRQEMYAMSRKLKGCSDAIQALVAQRSCSHTAAALMAACW